VPFLRWIENQAPSRARRASGEPPSLPVVSVKGE
jgi:hypothetical protein